MRVPMSSTRKVNNVAARVSQRHHARVSSSTTSNETYRVRLLFFPPSLLPSCGAVAAVCLTVFAWVGVAAGTTKKLGGVRFRSKMDPFSILCILFRVCIPTDKEMDHEKH